MSCHAVDRALTTIYGRFVRYASLSPLNSA